MSEHLLEQRGVYWQGWQSKFVIHPSGQEFACVLKIDGLKVLHVKTPSATTYHASTLSSPSLSVNTLHRRLAHLHIDGIKHFIQREGIRLTDSTFTPCNACALAKSTCVICREQHSRASKPFQRVHFDLCGPMSKIGIGNKKYFLMITDDHTRYRWVSCLHNKGQIASVVEQFFAAIANQYSSNITEVFCDNGTEFGSTALRNFLADKGCRMVHSAPYHHTQNGIAECSNGIITEKTRAMLLDSRLPTQLWPEAITNLTNCLPTTVLSDLAAPIHVLRQVLALPHTSNVDHL